MGFWIGLIVLFLCIKLPDWITNAKLDNYDMSKVDTSKMISDKVRNNLSDMQVRRNTVNGKYNKR